MVKMVVRNDVDDVGSCDGNDDVSGQILIEMSMSMMRMMMMMMRNDDGGGR